MIGLLILARELVRGAQAPHLRVSAPSPEHSLPNESRRALPIPENRAGAINSGFSAPGCGNHVQTVNWSNRAMNKGEN
jgi:hypothetical protein